MAIRDSGATLAIGARTVEPSVSNALPHFVPLVVFPLVIGAVTHGGWWIAGPVVFFLLADRFDRLFGLEERNMDLATTHESQLFLYKLSLWLWAALWPATFVFSLWQMLVTDRLAAWEVMVVAGILAGVGQTVFVVGHELVHRRAPWERRLGEFLLASASYPHYSTEHVSTFIIPTFARPGILAPHRRASASGHICPASWQATCSAPGASNATALRAVTCQRGTTRTRSGATPPS